jgi:pimeloyl-ACP methyl ester carboxylesterase
MKLRSIAHAAVLAWVVTTTFAAQAQEVSFRTSVVDLSNLRSVQLLHREPIAQPLRYRVIIIPGSGCAGMGQIADRYFAGLLHAQVLVLHKPGVAANTGLNPDKCPPDFIQSDALSRWLEDARWVLRNDVKARAAEPPVPQLLVGISEGAELLVKLAAEVPNLVGLVLLSGSGLDPLEAGAMQAQRLGQRQAWQDLARAQAADRPDSSVVEGRSLGYWRDLWAWRQSDVLIASEWPILQVWGDADELVPRLAYETFTQRAQTRKAPLCSLSLPGADHGLQAGVRDGVQLLWAWIENWGGKNLGNICDATYTY